MNSTATNFDQAELDKFAELAHRWWGRAMCWRAPGGRSRIGLRPAMDGWAGATHHGWFGARSEGIR